MQVISTATNTVVAAIAGFSGPFGIAINPAGTRAYVTNFGSNNFDPYGTTLSVVNLQTRTILKNVEVGVQPSGVAVSPDGRYVYVSNYNTLYQVGSPTFSGLTAGQGTVNVLDATTDTLLPVTIPVGQSPSNISVLPSGEAVYVSNFTSGTVSVLRGF
jgi:YVTN family beta-propeller protein